MNQAMTTPEQQAREMLEKATSSDLPVIVADIIAERDALKAELERVKVERDCWGNRWHQERRKVAELRYPGMTGVVKPMAEELAAIKAGAGEPVAWLFKAHKPGKHVVCAGLTPEDVGLWPLDQWDYVEETPLYTRPATPLTDEKVKELILEHFLTGENQFNEVHQDYRFRSPATERNVWGRDLLAFARAIEAHIKGTKP